ncbi:MAG TPA: DUF5916 domain-containing protein [Gemmatimonadaceae bacterium]
MIGPIIGLFAALLGGAPGRQTPRPVYNGREHELHVELPRLDGAVKVDGRLDEPEWREAALLTGFSQFSPQDGIPADDSTEVLVWYSSTAMYVGIRAFERHGTPHATLAQRDHVLDVDDNVQLYLGTFDDAREAVFLAVNPLGVQVDGTLRETYDAGNAGWSGQATARQAPDLSEDFVFDSRGRLTEWGYEVELRIPFRSLAFQMRSPQRWSFDVVRQVQHSGFEDSWTPARRGSASFLAQSGTLDGIRDVHRGLVLDANPVVTQRTLGAPARDGDPSAGWRYTAERPEVGANVRWRMTNNATIDATVNPDFSQVESDAGQVPTDPRARLFFPEKRPFFLDNLDAFATPNDLVYTRTIQEPVAAVKVTGRFRRLSVALLSAVDDRDVSAEPALGRPAAAPVVNLLRVQRDIGALSRVGVTYTDRVDGRSSNRVADVDGVFAFGQVYAARLQLAGSRTVDTAGAVTAPLWSAGLDRNGARFGMHYELRAMDPDFQTATGFIARPGLATGRLDHRFTWFGAPGAFLESASFEPSVLANWKYDLFVRGRDALEKKLHLVGRYQLRGGWTGSLALLLETFGYDPDPYRSTFVEVTDGARVDTVPFRGRPRLPNRDYVVSLGTPQWKWFTASALYLWGQDDNFDEWASADVRYATFDLLIHPTERLRIAPSGTYARVARQTTGEVVKKQRVYRVKAEYQITQPLFVRVVGEFDGLDRLPLRDDSRTNGPLLFRAPDGTFTRSARTVQRNFRTDVLLAWQPGPGTVFFAGYGASAEPDEGASWRTFFDRRYRQSETFFVKASYLLRL